MSFLDSRHGGSLAAGMVCGCCGPSGSANSGGTAPADICQLATALGTTHQENTMTDQLLTDIADYVHGNTEFSATAVSTARYCLLDSIGCGLLALNYPACTKLLGPPVPELEMQSGVPVPGTEYRIRFPPRSTLGPLFGGWITTTHGWLLSGAIRLTIWGQFWRARTIELACRASRRRYRMC